MSKGKIKAVLFFVLFFLVVALVCAVLLELQAEKNGTVSKIELPMATPTSYPTYEPTPAPTTISESTPEPVVIITPEPTALPVPTPTPTPEPTPVPTPEPAPEYIPTGTVIGEGQFQSDTGVPLNIRAVWTAEVQDDSRVKVTVETYLDSYSLQIREAAGAVMVSVGDSYRTGSAPKVEWDKNEKISTFLCATEHVVELYPGEERSFPVQVIYNFGGVYFKQELPTIECGGSIYLSR